MKRLIKKVKLKLFCDDANGEYGVCNLETFERYGTSFNAFWDGIGIFHDVFEHEHEFTKYFTGNYAMNIGGEMAAMGKMWYYQMKLGLYSKRRLNPQGVYTDGDNMRLTTESLVHEAIVEGYSNFGSTLESLIPKQRPVEDSELEYQIEEFWKHCKGYTPRGDKDYIGHGREYKKSVSFRKIADLHRWGYREGERYVPRTPENRETLSDFIDFWEKFCNNNQAKDIDHTFRELWFYIYKDKGKISWKARLMSKFPGEVSNYTIDGPYTVQLEPLYNYET